MAADGGTPRRRLLADGLFGALGFALAMLACSIALAVAAALLWKSWPLLRSHGAWELAAGTAWRPWADKFGFLPFIAGTAWVTLLSVALSTPVCVLSALYLSEYASRRFRALAVPLVDVLAGIPSVIYGMWGVLVLVPFTRDALAPACGASSSGYSAMAGALVLSLMVAPVVINVSYEVLRAVPRELRDATLALGATKWEAEKLVVLRKAAPGLVAAVSLGLSRAAGETMAVLMVCGNVARVPAGPFDPAYPLPALIANNYGEMMSIPKYDSALMLAALALLGVVLLFNAFSRLVLAKVERMAL